MSSADVDRLAGLCVDGHVSLKTGQHWYGTTVSDEVTRRRVDSAIALHNAALRPQPLLHSGHLDHSLALLADVHKLIVPDELMARDVVVLLSQFNKRGVSNYQHMLMALVAKLATRSTPYPSIEEEILQVRNNLVDCGHGEILKNHDDELRDENAVRPFDSATKIRFMDIRSVQCDPYGIHAQQYEDLSYGMLRSFLAHGWLDIVGEMYEPQGPFAALFPLTSRVLEQMLMFIGHVGSLHEQRTHSLLDIVSRAIVNRASSSALDALNAPVMTQHWYSGRSLIDCTEEELIMPSETRRSVHKMRRDARSVFGLPDLAASGSSDELASRTTRMSRDSPVDSERQWLRRSSLAEVPTPELFPGVNATTALRIAMRLAEEMASCEDSVYSRRAVMRYGFHSESAATKKATATAIAVLATYAVASMRLDGSDEVEEHTVKGIAVHAPLVRAYLAPDLFLDCFDHILAMI